MFWDDNFYIRYNDVACVTKYCLFGSESNLFNFVRDFCHFQPKFCNWSPAWTNCYGVRTPLFSKSFYEGVILELKKLFIEPIILINYKTKAPNL